MQGIYARTDNAGCVRLALLRGSGLAGRKCRGCDLGYADRARVAGEDRIGPDFLCEGAEYFLFEGEVL